MQFIFAGKAHPNDQPGQDLIKRIIEVAAMPQFSGKIIFLQNYDMELARRLVQGVDVWLNTPTRPLEASGTSGEKCVMNGVLQFSVLDGWWVEGYKEGAGWALPMETVFSDPQYQNELDAEMIYNTIEEEIVPKYYDRDADGIPRAWMASVKNVLPKSLRTSRPTGCCATTRCVSTTGWQPASGNCRRTTSPLRARSSPGSTRCWLRGLP